jgi:signal transduction histidine kinase
MSKPKMQFYHLLSQIGFLRKSYVLKFLFVAFIGIHVPLIGIVCYVGMYAHQTITPTELLLITLGFTLLATAGTLLVLNKLLEPVKLAKTTLLDYQHEHLIPNLPAGYSDEVGVLLHSIQTTIESLEAVNKTKSELMYTITHDLRSPLAQIISLTDLVKTEGHKKDQWLELIKSCAEQELQFIDNYITVIGSTDYQIKQQTTVLVSVNTMVDHVLQMMQAQIAVKHLLIERDIAPSASVATTKENLFERVIRNLVSNAIKFSHPGGKISIRANYDSDGKLIIEVNDTGIGIDPTKLNAIFDKFTEHKRLGTDGEVTNGIGLYLTREIIEQHQGTITASSAGSGKGATFKVIIENP